MNPGYEKIYDLIERSSRRFAQVTPAYTLAIDGIDCSGKTCFTRGLADYLQNAGHGVTVLHIDDFNDKQVQQEVYEAFEQRRFSPAHLDRFYNGSIDYPRAVEAIHASSLKPGLVLVEGVFLARDELVAFFDYFIYLQVETAVAEARFRERRISETKPRPLCVFRDLWAPAYERYLVEREPLQKSHLIIENSAIHSPRILASDA